MTLAASKTLSETAIEHKVKLVSISKPMVDGIDTAEEFIAYAARVSNPGNQMNKETSGKLVNYLIKNAHWSPLEMVHITMEINTTRDIARQILRHRSFAFQEFSQRYADASQLGYELREARLQDTKNRQNSVAIDGDTPLKKEWQERQDAIMKQVQDTYRWALDNGIAKEQARSVLPEGMIHSRLYMAGSFRSWYHYCDLRMAHGTQKEHSDIAKMCWDVLREHFPNVMKQTADAA